MRTVEDENNKLVWECPNCGNRSDGSVFGGKYPMIIVRRVCGYLSANTFNQGRHQEIKDRYIHLN